jgi:hypothetical protein
MGRKRIQDVRTYGLTEGQPDDYMLSRNFSGSINNQDFFYPDNKTEKEKH